MAGSWYKDYEADLTVLTKDEFDLISFGLKERCLELGSDSRDEKQCVFKQILKSIINLFLGFKVD